MPVPSPIPDYDRLRGNEKRMKHHGGRPFEFKHLSEFKPSIAGRLGLCSAPSRRHFGFAAHASMRAEALIVLPRAA